MEIKCGDALTILKTQPDESIHCCVTSPPYYNLRDYGVDGQIGLEQTPEQYIQRLTEVFREVRRVLHPRGTLWLNIGDCYGGSSKGRGAEPSGKQMTNIGSLHNQKLQINYTSDLIKPKDMIGIPWMLAFSLRNDGWYLRSDIIWHKTNAFPHPVIDRPVNCYEHVFLLSRSKRYVFNYQAIMEQSAIDNLTLRRGRDVWSMSKSNSKTEHYASFPLALAEKCILAGCPSNGIVLDPFCGAGTTGVAALKHQRDCLLIDIHPDYCSLSRKRIAAYDRKQ